MSKKYRPNLFRAIDRRVPVNVLYHLAVFIVILFLLTFLVIQNTGRQVSWFAWTGLVVGFLLSGVFLSHVCRRQKAESRITQPEVELQFHLLVESLPQNVYVKDVDGRFIFANQHYCATEGKSLDEIVGKTDFELHPVELAEKYRADDLRVIETGTTIELEEEHAGSNGERFFVQVIKAPFHDSGGQTAGTLGIFWDITERKRSEELLRQQGEQLANLYAQVQAELNERRLAEEALRYREAEYRLIADNTGDVIWMLDVESRHFIYASPSVEKMLGYTPQEMMAQTLDTILTPDSLAYATKEISKQITVFDKSHAKITNTDELDQVRKDGTIVRTEVSTTFVTNESGKLQIVGILRDITKRKNAEHAQRQSELQFRALFELSPDAVMLIDPHDPDVSWPIIDCNEAACLMNGYQRN